MKKSAPYSFSQERKFKKKLRIIPLERKISQPTEGKSSSGNHPIYTHRNLEIKRKEIERLKERIVYEKAREGEAFWRRSQRRHTLQRMALEERLEIKKRAIASIKLGLEFQDENYPYSMLDTETIEGYKERMNSRGFLSWIFG